MFLSKIAIKNPVFIVMITLALILFGIVAIKTLGVELTPSFDVPYVTITTVYPGADAKTIEEEVTKKIEDEVGIISGIDTLSSTVVDNVSVTVIKFKDNVKSDTATQDVRDKISTVKSSLPDDVEDPIVEKLDINATAFMSIILKAPAGANTAEVTELAKKRIKERIASIAGVGKVEMYGGREREIKILMNPLKLDSYKIPPISLIQMLGASSIKVPAGTIKMKNGSEDVSVKGDGEITTVSEFMEMPLLKSENGSTLKVKDFARVLDGLEEEESASFLDLSQAIGLDVKKQGKVNVVALAKTVRDELKKIGETLPEGYSIEVIGDTTPFTQTAVSGSMKDVFMGAVFAIMVVLLFLMNKRASLIIAVSLPTSIIGTFFFVKAMGFTLNFMTTLALSLSVGILTDDAIVVIEAIFRHVKEGKTKIAAAMAATNEVGLGVISAELSLLAVFGPTIIMSGLVGQLLKEFSITVVFAILISLIASFTVTPLFASYILKEEKNNFFLFKFMEKFLTKLENGYSNLVAFVLKHKVITLIMAIMIFVGSLSLFKYLKTTFTPDIDMGLFTVKVELPPETSIEKSKEVSREVIEKLDKYKWEKNVYTSIGASATKEKYIITSKVTMQDLKLRKESIIEAIDIVRNDFAYMKDKYNAKIYFIAGDENMSSGSPVQMYLLGSNFEELDKAGKMIIAFMNQDGGFKDAKSDNKGFKKEIRVKLDHQKMADLGVNSSETAIILRYLISGVKIAEFDNANGETDEVKVYIDDPYKNLDYIRNIPLKSTSMQGVRLSDVADITYDAALVQINRYAKNRSIQISSDVALGHDLGTQMTKLRTFASKNLPAGITFEEGGDAKMMTESFTDLITVLIIALFLVYIVLASQFNSFIHPLTIMTALPFAVTGALITLFITNMELSIFTFIGIIMLMGIVTKNSILLVDFTLQLIKEGYDVTSALVKSSKTRLRPILMTAGTTIIGMIPAVISMSEGAEMKRSMSWAVMGGLVFSTFVTLIIVPVIFTFMNKFSSKNNKEREKEIASL